jgi:GntP family gluconate:H+ symporter
MIMAGLVLSAFAASFGLAYAWWANRRWPIDVRSPSDGTAPAATVERAEHELPPLWLALAPIVLPVLFISASTFVNVMNVSPEVARLIRSIGHPNIALSIAAAIGLITVATRRGADRGAIRTTVQTALSDAGMIILITSAGGVFGGVLQETGVGERIQGLAQAYKIGVLPLAFLVTALIRVAQGSATVAMVTGVGIIGAFASSAALGFHPVYVALAIGCGSKMMPWMNDSGFWVVCKTSGLTEREMLRTLSIMFSIMSVVGFAVVTIAAALFPLV